MSLVCTAIGARLDLAEFESIIVMVNYDPEYPLTDVEMEKLEAFLESSEPLKRTECGFCTIDGLGCRIEVQVVASKDKSDYKSLNSKHKKYKI